MSGTINNCTAWGGGKKQFGFAHDMELGLAAESVAKSGGSAVSNNDVSGGP